MQKLNEINSGKNPKYRLEINDHVTDEGPDEAFRHMFFVQIDPKQNTGRLVLGDFDHVKFRELERHLLVTGESCSSYSIDEPRLEHYDTVFNVADLTVILRKTNIEIRRDNFHTPKKYESIFQYARAEITAYGREESAESFLDNLDDLFEIYGKVEDKQKP